MCVFHLKVHGFCGNGDLELCWFENDDEKVGLGRTGMDIERTGMSLRNLRKGVGSSRVYLGMFGMDIGIARMYLGASRVDLRMARVVLGTSRVDLGRARVNLGRVRVNLGRASVDLGTSRVDLGRARNSIVGWFRVFGGGCSGLRNGLVGGDRWNFVGWWVFVFVVGLIKRNIGESIVIMGVSIRPVQGVITGVNITPV